MSRNIRQFDNKCVRIIDRWGGVYDGICMFNSVDYNEHEFGRREEALQIENYIFYKRQIKQVVVLEDNSGRLRPAGRGCAQRGNGTYGGYTAF